MRKGFTLIELLVVITLIGLATVAGVAGYRRFNLRQLVITTGKQLLVDLRQAQTKSLNNVKSTSGCESTPLTGYILAGSGSSYTVTENYTAACGGGVSHIVKTVNLPGGVAFQSPFMLTFTGLSGAVTIGGASPIIFCNKSCQSGGLKYSMTVTTQGLIQDNGSSDIP